MLKSTHQPKEESMNIAIVTIEAEHNRRVQQGLEAVEEFWTLEEGYAVYPCGVKDCIQTTLEVDLGKYDSQGESYICELLNCLPGDIHNTYLEE
jgi:hypothetical protein